MRHLKAFWKFINTPRISHLDYLIVVLGLWIISEVTK